MRKLTSGLIAGSVIGIVGLTYLASDKGSRKRIVKNSKKAMCKANGLIDNIDELF